MCVCVVGGGACPFVGFTVVLVTVNSIVTDVSDRRSGVVWHRICVDLHDACCDTGCCRFMQIPTRHMA